MTNLVDRILAETSEQITTAITEGFPALAEAVIDHALEADIIDDAGDFVVSWVSKRHGRAPTVEGAVPAGPPLGRVFGIFRLGDDDEITEDVRRAVIAALPKGDHYDHDNLSHFVIRSNRCRGWTPWLVPTDSAVGMALPEKVIAEHKDLTVYRLETEAQIRYEGKHLRHCVAQRDMRYVADALENRCVLLSVRRGLEHCLATVEVRAGRVIQAQGKGRIGLEALTDDERNAIALALEGLGR